MADVTGPISTLPGAVRAPPAGARCDNHPERPATCRLQGETDSFGSEQHDLCDECKTELQAAVGSTRSGRCDWCKQEATDLRPHRDFEEGNCGRVYDVCGNCVAKETAALRAELEHDDWWWD